jgi:hypothetical protein
VRANARQKKGPQIREEEIHRKAQIYLLFEAKGPMFWNVADIRVEKGAAGSRRWIIAVHLHVPCGHQGFWPTSSTIATGSQN